MLLTQPTFLPVLTQSDIQHAVLLIQQSFASQVAPDDQRRFQWELFEVQKRFEAWGLVVPLLENPDPNVQFFGAHTAQLKIVRDWELFPKEHAVSLKDMLVDLTGRSIVIGRSKVILRKLYVALSQLALKLHPTRPSQWPNWILATVTHFSGRGASSEQILDFLSIVPEEIRTSDLLKPTKTIMDQSLLDALPLLMQVFTASRSNEHVPQAEIRAALYCLGKWIPWGLPADYITHLIPMLIPLLSFEESFVHASDVLQEILTSSSLFDGSGTKVLTEPLLDFVLTNGRAIYEHSISNGFVDETSHSFCKLLCAIGDHSTMYFASNLPSTRTQGFLRLMLDYTGLPGWFGIDEDESELCLGFWYLLQESLWSVDYVSDREPSKDSDGWERSEDKQLEVAKVVYMELLQVLQRKVMWPEKQSLDHWTKDQIDKFSQSAETLLAADGIWLTSYCIRYRRDVGDTLVNAYYVLRDKMLENLVASIIESLHTSSAQREGWEHIEAALHCITCAQEAVPIQYNEALKRLFGAEVLGKLPLSGTYRVRRTALQLIGAYATWFTTQDVSLLLSVVSFVVSALSEQSFCLSAASALKELCDANRAALAPHLSAFGDLHASISFIHDAEKNKILQSIASVIQAIPPQEAIGPVETIITPVVAKLAEAIASAEQHPEDARASAIQQIHALAGCARGLTSTAEPLFALEGAESQDAELEQMSLARQDPRMVKLRADIVTGLERAMCLWSTDAETAEALSDLFKAITCLPTDVTLISLAPGPLLGLTCAAAQRRLSATWLSLTAMLLAQLDPPSLTTLSLGPKPETRALVLAVLPALLEPCFSVLHSTHAMEAHPDIAQSFFTCMETVSQHFTSTIYELPSVMFSALMQASIGAFVVQERYALVAACMFLVSFIRNTLADDGNLADQADMLMDIHGKSILEALLAGFAAVAPRSALPNLMELLALIALKRRQKCQVWMREVLFSEHFIPCQASSDSKERFIKAVAGAHSTRKIRDAAHQFSLVARGLEGSSFGYATVSM